jgi:hypothetical protein
MSPVVTETINNKGAVPKKRRKSEYKELTDDDVEQARSVEPSTLMSR